MQKSFIIISTQLRHAPRRVEWWGEGNWGPASAVWGGVVRTPMNSCPLSLHTYICTHFYIYPYIYIPFSHRVLFSPHFHFGFFALSLFLCFLSIFYAFTSTCSLFLFFMALGLFDWLIFNNLQRLHRPFLWPGSLIKQTDKNTLNCSRVC